MFVVKISIFTKKLSLKSAPAVVTSTSGIQNTNTKNNLKVGTAGVTPSATLM